MSFYAIALVLLLLLSAFFSSSETAFTSLEPVRVETYLREQRRGAARVSWLLQQPTRLLSAILLGNNLTNTASAAVGTLLAAQIMGEGGVAVLVATAVVTLLLVLFGEIAPKTLALSHNWAFASVYAAPLQFWMLAARPVIAGLDLFMGLAGSLLGSNPHDPRVLGVAELRTAVEMGTEAGEIEAGASGIVIGALKLPERELRQVMVHRTNLVMIPASHTVRESTLELANHGFMRAPVFEDEAERVVGSVHLSDLSVALVEGRGDESVRNHIRPTLFAPEQATSTALLERMRQDGRQMAVVVDEFGAVSGAVTLEDLVEEIVGEIQSESGSEPAFEGRRSETRWVVAGTEELDAIEDEFGIAISHPDSQTIAGVVLDHLRGFPTVGANVNVDEYLLTISALDERRITEVTIERVAETDDAAGETTNE